MHDESISVSEYIWDGLETSCSLCYKLVMSKGFGRNNMEHMKVTQPCLIYVVALFCLPFRGRVPALMSLTSVLKML